MRHAEALKETFGEWSETYADFVECVCQGRLAYENRVFRSNRWWEQRRCMACGRAVYLLDGRQHPSDYYEPACLPGVR
jgi:hypothetical protein